MMKRTAYLWTLLIALGLGTVSCLNKEDMNRLNSLEERISKLEEAAGQVNSNTIAVGTLLKESAIVVGFKQL